MERNLKRMVGALVVQFFLGMGLNVIGQPTPDMALWLKVLAYFLLIWHVLNAINLVVLTVLIYRQGQGNPKLAGQVRAGAAFVVLAFVGGVLTVSVSTLSELFSFIMASGFMLAFIVYGRLYLQGRKLTNS